MKSIAFNSVFLALVLIISNANFGVSQNQPQREVIQLDFTKKQKFKQENNLIITENGLTIDDVKKEAIFLSKNINVPIKKVDYFITFAAVWEIKNYSKTNFKLYVRAAMDKKNWDEWLEILPDDHSQQIGETYVGQLMCFGKNVKYMQFKIIFLKENIVLKNIRFDFFSPTSPSSKLSEKKSEVNKFFNYKIKACPCPQPSYTTRTGWGCTDGQNSPNWPPQSTTVTHLIVHHSTNIGCSGPPYDAMVQCIWNYHAITKGWGDIGYNWLIDPNGIVYEGRAGGNNIIGAHF